MAFQYSVLFLGAFSQQASHAAIRLAAFNSHRTRFAGYIQKDA